MPFLGTAEVTLTLGPLKIKRMVSVAEIEVEVLLGTDILQQQCGPADILLSKRVMLLNNCSIPLKLEYHEVLEHCGADSMSGRHNSRYGQCM